MVNSVDSSKQQVGYRFTANLETNLQVGDVVVAPRGSTVYGRLANAKSAGNMSGGAELTLELTDIVINGTAYPLLTSTYQVASQGQGSNTAKKVVGGTGLGALIGGIAGGGKGAAIGAGAGAAVGLRHPQLAKASRYRCRASLCSNFACNNQSAFRWRGRRRLFPARISGCSQTSARFFGRATEVPGRG